MPHAPSDLNKIESLCQIIADLRGPEGCPWDKEQDHKSLAAYAIEESSELAEALETGHDPHICEELGDVLFQVILHSQLAQERNAFTLADVIHGISEKIVRRHPHVFSDLKVNGSDEVLKNWDEIKKLEKQNSKSLKKSSAIEVPDGMPALQRAAKIGAKTKKMKFDWTTSSEVLNQLKLEIAELEFAIQKNDPSELDHEMGDVLFSAAQLARHLNLDPESSLRNANRRFLSRFDKMLDIGQINIEQFTLFTAEKKEQLWTMAKKFLKSTASK